MGRRRVWAALAATLAVAAASLVTAPASSAGPLAPAPTVTAGVVSLTASWNPADFPAAAPGTTRTYTVELDYAGGPTTSAAVAAPPLTMTGLDPATSFTATVHAFDDATEVGLSDASTSAQPLAPSSVTSLARVNGNGTVSLSWAAATGATNYWVYRDGVRVITTARTAATDTGLTNGTVYVYTVVTRASFTIPSSGTALSAASRPVAALPASVPTVPWGLTGTVGDRQATLRWKAPLGDGGRRVSGYVVQTTDGTTLPACSPSTTETCAAIVPGRAASTPVRIIRNLDPDRAHRFRVRAVNAVGRSAQSSLSPALQPFSLLPPFSEGMKGASISDLQKRLTWAGLETPMTGVFDAKTVKQVTHLQEKFLYNQTGVVNDATWKLLKRITADGDQLPASCLPTSLCISKTHKVLRYVVNGKVLITLDTRFGDAAGYPTPTGLYQVNWKAREHTSSKYGSPMPMTMNFVGGVAVHYSYYFASDGYWGASHGCVNIRDWKGLEYVFNRVWVGTPVYVYY